MAAITTVQQLLESLNLQIYLGSFLNEGYDDLNQLLSMDESTINDVLTETGMAGKKGHRMRFLQGLTDLKKNNSDCGKHKEINRKEAPRKVQQSKTIS